MVLRAGFHGTVGQPSAQIIDGNLKFDKDKTTHLKRNFPYPGDVRQWTWSGWIQRTHFDSGTNFYRIFGQHETSHFYFYQDDLYFDIGGTSQRLITNQKFRDIGWFHLVVILQTENRTSSDRMRIYINGERVTSFSTSNYPADDPSGSGNGFIGGKINREGIHDIGYRISPAGGALSANMTQVYFINGQALEPEHFGFTDPLTNTWRPKKFDVNSPISTQYSGASTLTWDNSPIGSAYTLSNGNKTATAGDGNATYTGADVWSIAIPADSTYAWTLDTANADNVGGWYFTDSQTPSGTHPDERGGNSLGMRGQDIDAGWYGTFASANGGSNQSHVLDLLGTETWGSRRVDFVVYRPASGTGKVWVKNNAVSTWVGGGNPSDTSSTASFIIPDGTTYFGFTQYDRSSYGDAVITLDGDGSIQQKIGATSFYLPLDGNSPIGQDKSGKGNDWTPVNFGGSNSVDKATGALPILNTTQGGTQAGVGYRTDANASSLALALPLLGNKEDVHHLIKGSGSAKSVAANGNAAASSAQSNFYNGSYYFDGTDDYLDATITALGTRDFTVEFWCYTTDNQSHQTLLEYGDHTSNGFWISYRTGTGITVRGDINVDISNATYSSPAQTMPKEKWHHVALTRESNTAKLFVNGRYIGNCTWSQNYSATNLRLGHATYGPGSAEDLTGYLQDVRLYDGAVKYTGTTINEQSFVVPSTNPDILPDTPSGVSGGSKLTKITDGAVSFDGGGDFLTVADSTDFDHQSTFTWDCFVYLNAYDSSGAMIIDQGNGSSYGVELMIDTSGNIRFYQNNSTVLVGPSGGFTLKRWHHIAVSHDGTKIRLFLDGIKIGENTTSSVPANVNVPLNIGKWSGNTSYEVNGFISNLRFVNGTALYTSNFTPPTAPLTNVTNTKLLCCQSNLTSGAAAVSPSISGLNNGTVWSDYLTPSDNFTTSGKTAGFDGSTGTYSQPGTNSSSITFAPPGGITYSTSVEVYTYQSNGVFTTVSDGAQSVSWTTLYQGWKTIASGGGTFTSTKLTSGNPSASDSRPTFAAIRVDGTILVDPVLAKGDASATTFSPFNTIDTVRGQETGYATLNPLAQPISRSSYSGGVMSNGNLTLSGGSGVEAKSFSTIPIPPTGKYYFEMGPGQAGDDCLVQLASTDANTYDNGTSMVTLSHRVFRNEVAGVLGYAIDRDAGTYTVFKDGVENSSGSVSADYYYYASFYDYTNNFKLNVNFGQKPFKFPPPDGFQPLNAANVRPETVIARPDQYFNTTLWSGNNADPRQIDLGMAPDLIWVKTRNQTNWHWLSDSLRGTADKRYKLYSNSTNAQDTAPIYGQADSFNDFGFVAGGGTNNAGEHLSDSNKSGTNYICWSWKAGGSKNTFNVDDVGYANASDVGLNVGGQNGNAYDTSDVWSDDFVSQTGNYYQNSRPPSRAFDGSTSTTCDTQNANEWLEWTPTGGYAYTSKVEVYTAQTSGTYSFNGGSAQTLSSPNNAWNTVAIGSGTITSIRVFGDGSNWGSVSAFRVDGKILVDTNATPPNVPTIAATGASVGTKQGFSIIKYTGTGSAATISHGLSEAPNFILVKNLGATQSWQMFHTSVGNTKSMHLNTTDTPDTATGYWNDTDPTSTVFSIGNSDSVNQSTKSMIAYCWHDVPGLQKFGGYTANGAEDGNFIELGFRPAILWIKATGSYSPGNWFCHDAARDTFNPTAGSLQLDSNNAEDTLGAAYYVDFLSNGFKLRNTGNGENGASGYTYVYAAWAEAPAFNLYGGQSNAR